MVILRAAVEELADVGYGRVTIESIATRAGVGKSTIYRHWRDKLALIADAFETSHEVMVPDSEFVTWRRAPTSDDGMVALACTLVIENDCPPSTESGTLPVMLTVSVWPPTTGKWQS